jgi:hypothetical protein
MITLYCHNSRCFFKPFNASSDINRKTGRPGLACYKSSGFLLFLARLFGLVVQYQGQYINKGSMAKWFERHGMRLTSFKTEEINQKAWRILLREKQPELSFAKAKLSNEQIKSLSFSTLTERQFQDIFYSEQFKGRLELLNNEQILASLDLFDVRIFSNLNTSQIMSLDIEKFTKEQFHRFFDKSPDNVKRLTPRQLHLAFKHLNYITLAYLSEDQVKALVPLLTNEEIKKNHVHFSARMFELLSVDQVKILLRDLNCAALRKEQFLALMTNGTRVKFLDEQQIQKAVAYFDQRMLTWLTDTQLNAVKVEKLTEELKKLIADEKENRVLK